MVGSSIPEGDKRWAILIDLKEIVQLVLSPSFTKESIHYMPSKMSDHKQSLKAVFPDLSIITLNTIQKVFWTFGSLLDHEI